MNFETPAINSKEDNQLKGSGQLDQAIASCQSTIDINPEDFEAHYEQAEIYHFQGKLEEAIAAYRKVIELSPNLVIAHHNLGEVLTKLGRVDDAITSYRRAIELNPDFSGSYHNLGDVLSQKQQWEEALAAYRRALELNSNSFESYYNLGIALEQQQQWEEAANAYRCAVEREPNFVSYQKLGQSSVKQGNLDEAIAAYQKAILLNPNDSRIHHLLGEALQQRTQLDMARSISSYHHAIELNPDDLQTYRNFLQIQPDNLEVLLQLGNTLAKLEKWEEAVTTYRHATEFHPNSCEAYQNLGKILAKLGNVEEVIHCYRSAVELAPKSWDLHQLLAETLMQQGEMLDEAIACFNRAIELFPNANSYQLLGEILAKQGNLEEALASYRLAIQLNPECFASHSQLGVALAHQGNFDEAIVCYRRALELNPESIEVHSYLWTIINQRQNWAEATTWYRQIIDKQPDSAVTHYYLGTALSCQQLWEEAALSCRRGIELNPSYFWSHLLLGTALTQLEKWEEVAAAYRYAINFNPAFDGTYSYLGNALKKLSQWEEAIAAYSCAIERNANNIDAYEGLGVSLLQLDRVDEAISCYNKIVYLEIQSEKSEDNLELEKLLIQKGLLEQVIDCYHQTFNLTADRPKVYYKLSMLLARQGLLEEAATYFQKASQIPHSEVDYENIWTYLNQKKWVELPDSYYPTKIKCELVEAYFNRTSQYKIINMRYLSEPDMIFLEESGLSLFHMKLIGQDDIALEEIYINSFDCFQSIQLSKIIPKTTLKEIGIDWEAEANFSRKQNFQQSLVETGYIYSVCPFSGEVLRSNQSFYVDGTIPIIVYRFVGKEVFYLKCGHVHGGKMSIYFPHLELIVVLPSTTRDWGALADNDALLFNRFKAWLVSNWQQVKSYICNDKPKKVASVLGTIRNMGHDFWNLLTGIHYLYENKILHKVDKFLVGPFDHINIGDIFPEITSDKIVNFGDPWEIFQYILENNYVAVIATGFLLKEELANKMYSGAIKKCSPDVLETVEKAKKHFPLLWFEIRSSNTRVWVSQVEGIANIIKSLYSDFPNLGVVFAGWHRLAIDYPGAEAVIEREESIRKQILDMIPPEIETYSTIGRPLYEGIVWVNTINIHITPLGSGALLPINVANKIGVCYSNPNNLSNTVGIKLIYWRENMLPVRLISPSSVTYDASAYTSGQPAVNWSFHCDWRAIYDELIKILTSLKENN
ncbi:MAG: tetratricopeptide repeat protein [Oscillatoriales cyanobacterium RU_3_3]|nr:tetratricopeptide repeat protein [Oscillatoriales cyanobacterium RU_3_3]